MELDLTLVEINIKMHQSSDVMVKRLSVAGIDCAMVYLDALTDKELLEEDILRPLMRARKFAPPFCAALKNHIFYAEDVKELEDTRAAVQAIADGDIVFLANGADKPLLLSLRKFEKRAIAEPPTSSVLKGPREGFVEEFKTNISMIRRRLRTPELSVDNMKIGRQSQTNVAVVYLNGIASTDVVEQLKSRLEAIDIDAITDSSYIATLISTQRYSMFNTVGMVEKPDIVSAKLLEGRVAIVVDGSPIVLTVPFMIVEDLQDGYDYYQNDWRATMIRVFRLIGAMLTILLPGAYVALQSYHYHLLPLKFLITLINATSGIPFPPAIEMLVVMLLFEILNQASIRMPRFMGISLSVVGAIVLGDTAVKAGLISSPAVLVVALSAIGIFCVPDQVGMLSLLRLIFLLSSAVLGLFGMIMTGIVLLAYLCSIENFGTPYLAPYAPRINPDLKDGIIVSNRTEMIKRPFSIANGGNRVRLAHDDEHGKNPPPKGEK